MSEAAAELPDGGSNVTPIGSRRIPKFERKPVDGLKAVIAGGSAVLDPDMPVFGIDDRVQVLTEYKCVGVRHEADKNGDLIRVQVLRPLSMTVVPFNPEDDEDDGVVRAP